MADALSAQAIGCQPATDLATWRGSGWGGGDVMVMCSRQRETAAGVRRRMVVVELECVRTVQSPVRWCDVRCRVHCYVGLGCRRKDGSALALEWNALSRVGVDLEAERCLDKNTEHRLV